jgi:hypothetical protein
VVGTLRVYRVDLSVISDGSCSPDSRRFPRRMSGKSQGEGGRALNPEQRRALQMLASASNGCTEPAMRARGFTVGLLVGLVTAGLAVAKPDTMNAAGRTFSVVRFVITNSGRDAIGE